MAVRHTNLRPSCRPAAGVCGHDAAQVGSDGLGRVGANNAACRGRGGGIYAATAAHWSASHRRECRDTVTGLMFAAGLAEAARLRFGGAFSDGVSQWLIMAGGERRRVGGRSQENLRSRSQRLGRGAASRQNVTEAPCSKPFTSYGTVRWAITVGDSHIQATSAG
jgi:hypothetical protein